MFDCAGLSLHSTVVPLHVADLAPKKTDITIGRGAAPISRATRLASRARGHHAVSMHFPKGSQKTSRPRTSDGCSWPGRPVAQHQNHFSTLKGTRKHLVQLLRLGSLYWRDMLGKEQGSYSSFVCTCGDEHDDSKGNNVQKTQVQRRFASREK